MKKWLNEKVFVDNKKTLLFISVVTFLVLFIYQIVLFCCGGYFNSNSDDVAQYSPILMQYINYFKEGKFSWYNFTNNTGASVFADVYYVPFDIFTLLVFLLSYVVDDAIAFSIINLSKILFGVVVFAYYLQRKGFKNWIVGLLCLMYFCFGGAWIFSVYPTYFSLYFYLPLSLLVIDYYAKGKKWMLPLYSLALVLYNFYNAYTLFIFMVFVYIVVKIRDDYSTFKKLVKDVIVFGLHLVLGVVMGLVIFVPSFLYILNYSIRNDSYFEWLFEPLVYARMLFKLFSYETGVVSFVLGGYIQGHFNYYIGLFGLFLIILMFTMKDRTSKIYKYSLLVVMAMMMLPIFSMIFSGVGVAYTRWFNFINIILIYMVGHVLTNYEFSSLSHKKTVWMASILVAAYFLSVSLSILFSLFAKNNDIVGFEKSLNGVIMLLLFGIPFILEGVFLCVKKKDLVVATIGVEMLIAMLLNLSVSFGGSDLQYIERHNNVNNVLKKLDIEENSLDRVYVTSNLAMNGSRGKTHLINERTFHSFLTKYMYDYHKLYGDDLPELYTTHLNRFNPYNSRVMDYKYIVVDKEDAHNYNFDYLEYYKEIDNYIIYNNLAYQPFYVYESYYEEKDVLNLSETHNYLGFERNLFDGVILEEGEYNLENKEYNYDSDLTNRISFNQMAELEKVDENKYELNIQEYTQFGYDIVAIFRDFGSKERLGVKVVYQDGEANECMFVGGVYRCHVGKETGKVVISGNPKDLRYAINAVIDDSDYRIIVLPDNSDKEYFSYYLYNDDGVILKKGELEEKECLQGLCFTKDFDFDHILVVGKVSLEEEKEMFFDYYYDDLEFYQLNKGDKFAKDKQFVYNGSSINVKYTSKSTGDNDQVVVLPITYSEEWQVDGNSEDYEIVRANGGYLGIIVKNNVQEVNFTLTFRPTGVTVGLIGSLVGFGIYGVYCISAYLRKRRKKNEIIEE